MAGKMSEIKTDIFVTKCSEEIPEFILAEVSIKQEPELIIEDELETEKIGKYLHKNNVTQEDRLNLTWHSCGVCEEPFLSTDELTLHSQNHKNSELKEIDQKTDEVTKFRCTMCDKKYTTKRNLNVHLRLHTDEKPFKCDTCNRLFNRSDYLRLHMRTHTGEKPYKCDICNSSFAHRGNLQKHMRTHTGEKPFKCDHCNTSFAHNGSLRIHMTTHTGEKPFKCDNCNSSFAYNRSLQNHMRTHADEKPFKKHLQLK